MNTNTPRRSQSQLMAGVLLLVLAASILIVLVGDLSIWFFLPVLITLVGLTFIALSFGEAEELHPAYSAGPTQSRYRFTWGYLLAVLGVLGLLSLLGVDLAVLIVLLIVCVAALILHFWWKGGK